MSLSEFNRKLSQTRSLAETFGLSGVLFTTQSGFSWITCGGQNHVGIAGTKGSSKILVTADDVYLLANKIEMDRMLDEELGSLPVKQVLFDWFKPEQEQQAIKEILGDQSLGADDSHPLAKNISSDLARMKYSLSDEEIERYKVGGRLTGESIGEVCKSLRPGMNEYEVAARLAGALYERGVIPVLTLVASDDRIEKYRHPLPADKTIVKTVMAVVCGRYKGLISSVTRMVSFGEPDGDLRQRHQSVVRVDATLIQNTIIDVPYSDVFAKCVQAYESEGYPEEWTLHHQGGPTGYEGRDFKATFDSHDTVKPNQAVAWNPSITGTKSEDTVICKADGHLILTESPDWPMLDVELNGTTIRRPDILVL